MKYLVNGKLIDSLTSLEEDKIVAIDVITPTTYDGRSNPDCVWRIRDLSKFERKDPRTNVVDRTQRGYLPVELKTNFFGVCGVNQTIGQAIYSALAYHDYKVKFDGQEVTLEMLSI